MYTYVGYTRLGKKGGEVVENTGFDGDIKAQGSAERSIQEQDVLASRPLSQKKPELFVVILLSKMLLNSDSWYSIFVVVLKRSCHSWKPTFFGERRLFHTTLQFSSLKK
ncbi:hypothetical protein HAX54_048988 [Datura stramonium]|uniref:Uncharacterized protein n=1 Tax=Datura stramonium TaxID=4076 RepID=A0ABS8WMJ2_DATST|nr:hypothetical protein [Datura stramonium]